jgi:hypothetical protein
MDKLTHLLRKAKYQCCQKMPVLLDERQSEAVYERVPVIRRSQVRPASQHSTITSSTKHPAYRCKMPVINGGLINACHTHVGITLSLTNVAIQKPPSVIA